MLGAVMILTGLAVLADVAFAVLVSSAFIGAAAIAVGAFEIIHAVWTRGWGGLAWQALLGFLYVAAGIVLLDGAGSGETVVASGVARSTRSGELLLTYGLGLLLLLSGTVRILLGWRRWWESGWVMLLSGAFGVMAGVIVLTEFPKIGLWVFGLLLGVDLMVHGAAWLGYAFSRRARTV
ncbi:uncharacterized membrane protein HdeD (DUF308 family) [Microvirga lupini]|uniref:Uncharacterized membrane protein HdeD (DUF308 family) n=1 Tax=Microvirga lupini TaxID=420324 RepID=A0A7W4VR59_9HYPH|nr:DUF308 domain-containing protein [Microvirga lupini]MBB3021511.1 uncharacterized membrane protein HdeD (DUF308 family) [Microvirga lupini]